MSMWNDCPEPDLEPPEASLNYHEEEDEEEVDMTDYEDLAQRKREYEEWESNNHDWGNWHYPNDGRW